MHPVTAKQDTMSTIPTDRTILSKPQQAARCRSSKKQQAAVSNAGFIANGFLKCQFLPLYQPPGKPPRKTGAETAFFTSLAILNRQYGLATIDVSDKPYPYNVLLAHWDAERQLNAKNQEVELTIVRTKKRQVCLAAKQVYNTRHTLYYIPVLPLYRLIKSKKQRQATELLLSTYCYLYQVAGVPYYRDEGGELYSYYGMLQGWYCDDADDSSDHEHTAWYQSELNKAAYYGDDFWRMISNAYHLHHFGKRLAAYVPATPFEKECGKIARAAHDLYQCYPKRSVFDHAGHEQEGDEDDYVARMGQYLSFIAEVKGELYDELFRIVNDSLNECGTMEEPQLLEIFDHTYLPKSDGLNFEHRLFSLLGDLCTLLNDIE